MAPLPLTPSLLRQLEAAQKVPMSPKKLALQIHAAQLRVWLSDQTDVACRPYYIFCLELYPRGQVINQVVHSPASQRPSVEHLLSFLLRHITSPPTDETPVRPTHVSFVDDATTDALRPILKRLAIHVGTLTLADGVDDYVRKFSEKLIEKGRATRGDASERAGLLSTPNVTTQMSEAMVRAAVALHADAPWTRIPEHIALEVRLPSEDRDKYRPRYYLTVLGSDQKSVKGFALMASLSALREKYRRAMISRTGDFGDSEDSDDEEASGSRPKHAGHTIAEDVLLCAACGRRIGETVDADGARHVDRCGGCRRLLYCGEACQKYDWRERHRKECHEARDDKDYSFKRDEWNWLRREIALLFLDPTSIPFDDLDAYEEHKWPYLENASPPLYPMPFVTIQAAHAVSNRVDRPAAKELEAITLISKALPECSSTPPADGVLHLKSGVSIRFAENLADSIHV